MPKVDGYLTREKILEVAEELFSELGYDATSVGSISKKAGINKATIYYHFEDKKSILHSLYENLVKEMRSRFSTEDKPDLDLKSKIKKEINYLRGKKDIISILLMEAMKTNTDDNSLFQIALSDMQNHRVRFKQNKEHEIYEMFVLHEFFTGFIPVLNFVVLEDKYCEFFKCSKNEILDKFIDVIEMTHFKTHYQ